MAKREPWVIESYRRVGPIRFGTGADEVRRLLGVPHEPLRGREEPVDAFVALGVHVCYDGQGGCEAVEFYKHAVDPVFDGLRLLEMPYGTLERELLRRDPELRLQIAGFISMACGVGASGNPDRGRARATDAIAFRRGYYDGSMAALDGLARR